MLYRFQPDYESRYALTIERADSRDRNTGGRSTGNANGGSRSGSTGGGGGAANKGGPALNSQQADMQTALGMNKGARSIPSTGVARGNYPSQEAAYGDYSKAVGDYATRSWVGKVADFLGGPYYDQNEPMAGNPRSFSGATYHTSSNPAGVLAGLASPYGGSLLSSPIASTLYNKAGLPNIWHGGYDQPDMRSGWFGNTPSGYDQGASFSDMGGMNSGGSLLNGGAGATNVGGPSSGLQNPGRPTEPGEKLHQLSQLNQGVSGNPGAPVSVGAPPPTATPGPDYTKIMASIRQVTPNYGIQLPGYQYQKKATV